MARRAVLAAVCTAASGAPIPGNDVLKEQVASYCSGPSAYNTTLYGNISEWDTSPVVVMDNAFIDVESCSPDISMWNTSAVTSMISMFAHSTFNSPINAWDVSSLVSMESVFESSPFNQDINGWNTASVASMDGSFMNAANFSQLLSGWDVSDVRNGQFAITGQWFGFLDVFRGASAFLACDCCRASVGHNPTWPRGPPLTSDASETAAAWAASYPECPVPIPSRSVLVAEVEAYCGAPSAYSPMRHGDIAAWNTSLVQNMYNVFQNQAGCNPDISRWDTSGVVGSMEAMFSGASAFNANIGGWDVSGVNTMDNMFSGASAFAQVVSGWNVSSLLNANSMFYNAARFEDERLGRWDVSGVTDMGGMFYGATAFLANDCCLASVGLASAGATWNLTLVAEGIGPMPLPTNVSLWPSLTSCLQPGDTCVYPDGEQCWAERSLAHVMMWSGAGNNTARRAKLVTRGAAGVTAELAVCPTAGPVPAFPACAVGAPAGTGFAGVAAVAVNGSGCQLDLPCLAVSTLRHGEVLPLYHMYPCTHSEQEDCFITPSTWDDVIDVDTEVVVAEVTTGTNMSTFLWGWDDPQHALGTRATLMRRKEYGTAVTAQQAYFNLVQLGMPDPRDGQAMCVNDYYCMPGPCRLLDINYFADPTYNIRYIDDNTWMVPSRYNFRFSYSDKSVSILGHSQCSPMFGTEKVYYKGEINSPVNFTDEYATTVAARKDSYRYMSAPDGETQLWPDILSVPSPYQAKSGTGSNVNPRYMYTSNRTWEEGEGVPRRPYRCEDANTHGGPGLRRPMPAVWLEPVPYDPNACAVVPGIAGDTVGPECVMYRATTEFRKDAFTNASYYWSRPEGCELACNSTVGPGGPGGVPCREYCADPASKRCSNPMSGAKDCTTMGAEQFGYSYEAFFYWRSQVIQNTRVAFSPMHVGCNRMAGDESNAFVKNGTVPGHALRPRISPQIKTHLDGTCYMASDGNFRLPHGVLSMAYGQETDFAMITTYPQAAVSPTESHPGVFSSYAQALGIVFPPYAQDVAAANGGWNSTVAYLKTLNPFIDWGGVADFPRWHGDMCHIFTMREPGGGCSMLPHLVPPVNPGCGAGRGAATPDLGNRTHTMSAAGETVQAAVALTLEPGDAMTTLPLVRHLRFTAVMENCIYAPMRGRKGGGAPSNCKMDEHAQKAAGVGVSINPGFCHDADSAGTGGAFVWGEKPESNARKWDAGGNRMPGGYIDRFIDEYTNSGDTHCWGLTDDPDDKGVYVDIPAFMCRKCAHANPQRLDGSFWTVFAPSLSNGEHWRLLNNARNSAAGRREYPTDGEFAAFEEAYAGAGLGFFGKGGDDFFHGCTAGTGPPLTNRTIQNLLLPIPAPACTSSACPVNYASFRSGPAPNGTAAQDLGPCRWVDFLPHGWYTRLQGGRPSGAWNLFTSMAQPVSRSSMAWPNTTNADLLAPPYAGFPDAGVSLSKNFTALDACVQKMHESAMDFSMQWPSCFATAEGVFGDAGTLSQSNYNDGRVWGDKKGNADMRKDVETQGLSGRLVSYREYFLRPSTLDTAGPGQDQANPYDPQNPPPEFWHDWDVGESVVPDARAWGYGGVRKTVPLMPHLVKNTTLGSGFGFLDIARAGGLYECTNAYMSWEPNSVPVDSVQLVNRARGASNRSDLVRAPTGSLECMEFDTSNDTARADRAPLGGLDMTAAECQAWLSTTYNGTRGGMSDADCLALVGSILGATRDAEAAFGASNLYTNLTATTLMLRDARLPEHLSYMDVYTEGTGSSEGTHWWLGGTAVSLRMSRLLNDSGSTLAHEVINNTYKALLILDPTGSVADWPGGDRPNRSLDGEAVPLFPGGGGALSPGRAFAPSSHVYSGDPAAWHNDPADPWQGCNTDMPPTGTVCSNNPRDRPKSAQDPAYGNKYTTYRKSTRTAVGDSPKRETRPVPAGAGYCAGGVVTSKGLYYDYCVENTTAAPPVQAFYDTPSGRFGGDEQRWARLCMCVVTCGRDNWADSKFTYNGTGGGPREAVFRRTESLAVRMPEHASCQVFDAAHDAKVAAHAADLAADAAARVRENPGLYIKFFEPGQQRFKDHGAGNSSVEGYELAYVAWKNEVCGAEGSGRPMCEALHERYTFSAPDVNDDLFFDQVAFDALAGLYPGLKPRMNNFKFMQFVNMYEVAVFYTGWAPAGTRSWSAAVQNSERQAGFACDCDTGEPGFYCQRVAVEERGRIGWDNGNIDAEVRALRENNIDTDTVDLVRCSFAWKGRAALQASDVIGLYMWSEKKDFQVLQTDLFHGHSGDTTATQLATQLLADGGFNERLMDRLVFKGYDPDAQTADPSVVAHTTFPTSCLRWPYGQVHVSSFTDEGRSKWYPPDFHPHDALMGYCEQFDGRFVHCRRDGMSLEARTAFCGSNVMASYVVAGLVLKPGRTLAQACSPSRHLCILVPGYGAASSLHAIVGEARDDTTVLVAPFNRTHVEYIMQKQWYKSIGPQGGPVGGNDPLEHSSSQLTFPWDFSRGASPLGVGEHPDLVALLARVPDSQSVAGAVGTMTRFWGEFTGGRHTNPDACPAGHVSVPGPNGGRESVLCIPVAGAQHDLDDVGVRITRPGVSLLSGVGGLAIRFSGSGTRSSCERLLVEAPRFRLGSASFDQRGCRAADDHKKIPVVVYGKDSTGFVADGLSVQGSSLPFAALGGYVHTERGAMEIDVDGMRVAVASVTGPADTYCAAFARAFGRVRLACDGGPMEVVVQSAAPSVSVDLMLLARANASAPYGPTNVSLANATGYAVLNLSDYTGVFGTAEEQRLFHRAPDLTPLVWLTAVGLALAAGATVAAAVLLWARMDAVLAAVARVQLNHSVYLAGHGDSFRFTQDAPGGKNMPVYIELTDSIGSGGSGTYDAWVVAGKILYTHTQCYDAYPGLVDHVRASVR